MKSIINYLRENPAVYSLIIFLGMILPSLLIFTAVEKSNMVFAGLLLGLVVLANLAAVFPPRVK